MAEESLLSGAVNTDTGVQQDADGAKVPDANTDAGKPAEGAVDPVTGLPVAKVESEGGKKEEPKEPVVPEKYEFALPEGVELDGEVLGEFETHAKELKLTQEQAQPLVNLALKVAEKAQAAQSEAWANQRKVWRDEVANDKEIGGKENLGYAARAIDTFAPELRQVFNDSGWGDNPAFIRAFVRIGKAISEDRLVGGFNKDNAAPRAPENVLYPGK